MAMPELGSNKKKKEAEANRPSAETVVSAYSDEGAKRAKEDQKKTRIAAIVGVLILLAAMTVAVIIKKVI